MHLFAIKNSIDDTRFDGAHTPENCIAYYYSRRVLKRFGPGNQIDLHALGYQEAEGGEITILWYDENMSLIQRETRKPEDCLAFLLLSGL